MCPSCRLWGMLEEIPSIFFPSLCRSLNLLHHDSMHNPKPDEEIQKFHPKSSSTYTSAGATREFQREEVKQDLSRQIYWDLEHRLMKGGAPLTPTPLPGTKSRRTWGCTSHHQQANLTPLPWLQDHHITSPHSCGREAEGWSTKGMGFGYR